MHASFLIKREIEEESQGNLKEKLIITWNESIQLFNNSLLLHFGLVVAKYGQLLQEIQHDEEQIRIVSVEHGQQKVNDLSVSHLSLDLQILCQVE